MIRLDMSETNKIIIQRLPLLQVVSLRQLFTDAVHSSFTYFNQSVQDKTIRSHSSRHLVSAIINPRRVILTASMGKTLIGYAIGSVPKGRAGQMYWLYVVPGVRGQNTGLALLSRLLKAERALGAETVSLATYDHRNYYERQGFRFIETTTVDGVKMDIMRFYL